MRAKFIHESLKDILKPKDLVDVIKEMDWKQKIVFYYSNYTYYDGMPLITKIGDELKKYPRFSKIHMALSSGFSHLPMASLTFDYKEKKLAYFEFRLAEFENANDTRLILPGDNPYAGQGTPVKSIHDVIKYITRYQKSA